MAPNQIKKNINHRAKILIRDIPDPNFRQKLEYHRPCFPCFPNSCSGLLK